MNIRTPLIVIVTIVAIAVAVLGYRAYFISPTIEGSLTATPREELPGGNIITQLERLPQTFDTGVLTDPAYQKLVDGTVDIAEMPTGKSNPFASIGLPRQAVPRR